MVGYLLHCAAAIGEVSMSQHQTREVKLVRRSQDERAKIGAWTSDEIDELRTKYAELLEKHNHYKVALELASNSSLAGMGSAWWLQYALTGEAPDYNWTPSEETPECPQDL